jgi:hypothetical protein
MAAGIFIKKKYELSMFKSHKKNELKNLIKEIIELCKDDFICPQINDGDNKCLERSFEYDFSSITIVFEDNSLRTKRSVYSY